MFELPPYIRFATVRLEYRRGRGRIGEKCAAINQLLPPFAMALKGSKLVFIGGVDQYAQYEFSNHSQLLHHIGNELLPICDYCREYEFSVAFWSDNSARAARKIISSLLQMDPIKRSSNITFTLFHVYQETELPIDEIENWLIYSSQGKEANLQKQKEKFLQIQMENIQNNTEMNDRLKEV